MTRAWLVGVMLSLTACSCGKRGGAKVGVSEPGRTRVECKTSHKVVDDPAKCEQQ